MTHSFHCCAFKFPSRHDPRRHAERLKEIEKWQQQCINNKKNNRSNNVRKLKQEAKLKTGAKSDWDDDEADLDDTNDDYDLVDAKDVSREESGESSEVSGKTWSTSKASPIRGTNIELTDVDDFGMWHSMEQDVPESSTNDIDGSNGDSNKNNNKLNLLTNANGILYRYVKRRNRVI